MTTPDNSLFRYTSLPVLIDILTNKHLTLLSPSKWPDRNDAYSLELYRSRSKASHVLAICFTTREETCHHWSVFSQGDAGARIEFHKQELLAAIDGNDLITRDVDYREIPAVEKNTITTQDLPFLKRAPYRDEGEFRFIYISNDNTEFKNVAIPLNCIKRVTLSPWLHSSIAPSVKSLLKKIDGCTDMDIYRSTLLENNRWKSALAKEEAS
jgi:hypothetical protein